MHATTLAVAVATALLAAPAPAIELRLEGNRLVVTGSIEPDDDFELLTALVANREQVRIVHFHDMPGGEVLASLRMGNIIRWRASSTRSRRLPAFPAARSPFSAA